MTDSLKDIIIVILLTIAIYLVYKKFMKTKLVRKCIGPIHLDNYHLIVQHPDNQHVGCHPHIVDNHLSINSNSLSDDVVVSNVSDHELVHIDDSKPFLSNHDVTVNNEINHGEELVVSDFNYTKEFEEDFQYYDPEIHNATY
jgi:hypothetical protein